MLIPAEYKAALKYVARATTTASGTTTYASQLAEAVIQNAYAALTDDEKLNSIIDIGLILRYMQTGVYTAVNLNGAKNAGIVHVIDVPNKTYYQVSIPDPSTGQALAVNNRSQNLHSTEIKLSVLEA